MSRSLNSNFEFKSLIVAVLCLSGAAAGSYFLYRDFNQEGAAGHGSPLAKIDHAASKVRRKAASTYVWTIARLSEDLYKRDSIQTGAGSSASVEFKDGSKLELGENSLVVIDDLTNLSLNFLAGSAVVRRADGNDQQLSVGKDGKAKVEQLSVRLISPESHSQFVVSQSNSRSIHFAWEVLGKEKSKIILEISPDSRFKSQATKRFEILDPTATKEQIALLSAGHYFWRISSSQKALTETGQFSVFAASSLKPTYPVRSEKLITWFDNAPVQFRWAHPSSEFEDELDIQNEHTLEVSIDADFKTVLASEKIDPLTGLTNIKTLSQGNYFWRIRSKFDDVAVSSTPEKFTIEHGKKFAIDLGKPGENASSEATPNLRFNWNADAENVDYVWEVIDSSGKSVIQEKTKLLAWKWPQPNAGSYKWHVTALGPQGQVMGESPLRTFSLYMGKPLALNEPKNGAEIRFWEKEPEVEFAWDKDDLVEEKNYSYQVEVSSDSEFKKIVATETSKKAHVSSKTMKLPLGGFFWRVKVIDSTGAVAKTSDPGKFSYDHFAGLIAPEITAPQANQTFSRRKDDTDPVIEWKRVDHAKAYEVTVIKFANDGRNPAAISPQTVFHQTLEKASVELAKLAPGKYRYTIRAVDQIDRAGETSKTREFSVTLGNPLQAPKVTSPEVQ